jgi:hypothetical protein
MTRVEDLIKESPIRSIQDVRTSVAVRRGIPDIDDAELEAYLADSDEGRYLRECRYRGVNDEEIEYIRRRLAGKIEQVNAFDKYRTTDFVPQPHQLTVRELALADKLITDKEEDDRLRSLQEEVELAYGSRLPIRLL